MRKPATFIFSSIALLIQTSSAHIFADATDSPGYQESSLPNKSRPPEPAKEQPPQAPFNEFTGRVIKNKVRLRQSPALDSPILKELNNGDMVIVVGENDDFYAVQPPGNLKAYIYRTYVLDNVIEGNRVNIRLEPNVDAPVVAQLNAGTRVEGTISPANNKWLEIAMPDTAQFYVAKEYIEKIGDKSLMAVMEKRKEEVNRLLNSTYMVSQSEMQKSFPEINLSGAYENFNKVINNYKDFPEQVERARELLTMVQDNYLQKKVAYLEAKAKAANEDWNSKNTQLSEQMKLQQQRLSLLEQQLEREKAAKASRLADLGGGKSRQMPDGTPAINNKMTAWIPREQEIYQDWAVHNNNRSQEEFYQEQLQQSVAIRGIVEPYTKAIKNKPGDYLLINQASHLPIAYLYSTTIDLHDIVGHEATLRAVPRSNNNFAFPAYLILSVD